jgi:uncharacterized membrane protein YfcA
MKLHTLMVINAVASAFFGLGFILSPAKTLSLYGHDPDAVLSYMTQLLGAALLSFAVLTWAARNSHDSDARRAILLALVIGYAIGFVLALIAQIRGVDNAFGWSTVVIYLLFTLAFGYFRFVGSASQGN